MGIVEPALTFTIETSHGQREITLENFETLRVRAEDMVTIALPDLVQRVSRTEYLRAEKNCGGLFRPCIANPTTTEERLDSPQNFTLDLNSANRLRGVCYRFSSTAWQDSFVVYVKI